MAGVYRQPISTLQPGAQNTLIIGVIINSRNPRSFNFEDKNRSGQRSVWTITLRDSIQSTINATIWGTTEFINKLSATYRIGSVIDVINAKVQERKPNDKNEAFLPSVSSPCCLIINEGASLIQNHDGADREEYEGLLSVPTKSLSNVKSLQYIMENMEALINQYLDIIVVVTFIGESKNIITKDGRSMVTRDFEVTDESCGNTTVALKFWENDWVQRSGDWEPKRTVLFIVDIQVAFDRFKKKNTIIITRKTMITENPNIPQAEVARKSINTESEYMPNDPFVIPKPETIKNIMTINEITQRLNSKMMQDGERVQFVTVLYGQIMEMNLDDLKIPVLIERCALCKRLVSGPDESCMNLNCPCGNGRRPVQNVLNFYVKVNLKDETGYLVGCRLSGDVAEKTFGCTPDEFKKMSFEERTNLKWKFMTEQVEIKLQVIGPTSTFPSQEYYSQEMNLVEVIRDELRQATIEVRRNHRTEEQNKRRALGEIIKNDDSWTLDTIIKKTKDLRKKPLSIDDYIKLQNSLIQDEENIKGFLSVGGSIAALIRDLTSIKPSIELAAAHCCCNIALGNKSQCTTLCKYAGPYLVEQLDTLSNPLLEISAWTVGNLCGGSKNAFKALYAQGCLCRLLSLLRDCDIIILPSIIYAVTQCLNEGFELINDLEAVEMSKGIIERGCYDNSSGIWVLALLSSKLECRETLCTILSSVFDLLMVKINEEPSDTKLITAAMRLLANLIPESTGFAANVIFYNPKYSINDVEKLFNRLLLYPHVHVRKETLWLLGNLYNHPQEQVSQAVKDLLPRLANLKLAIQSVTI